MDEAELNAQAIETELQKRETTTSGNFHIFALGLLHPKQPSDSKTLV